MVFVLLGLLSFIVQPVYADEQETSAYEFGVFPHMPSNKLFQVYQPIAEDFQQLLNRPIVLLTKPSYKAFQQGLAEQRYDIAFVQPFDYITAHDQYQYLPIARRGVPLKTIIVVRKESPLNAIDDLKGRKLQALSTSAAVSRVAEKSLQAAGFNLSKDLTIERSKNHFACMQRVLISEADACVTARRALVHFESVKMKDKFRIIYEAPPIPHALFIVHSRVPVKERDRLQERILAWPETPKGQQLLRNGNITNFSAAVDTEYDVLR